MPTRRRLLIERPIEREQALAASRIIRFLLWAGILITARADRRETGLRTAWVPHLAGNSFSLLLPEIWTAARRLIPTGGLRGPGPNELRATLDGVIDDLVVSNPRYFEYVAPAALAYILTYPTINIYRNEKANRMIFGLGLDSIPHATTALAITQLVFDLLGSLKRHAAPSAPLAASIEWAEEHAVLVSGGVIAGATAFYESGEYAIHVAELEQVHNDPTKIAMEWSVADTAGDILSNVVGWLLAVLSRQAREVRPSRRVLP